MAAQIMCKIVPFWDKQLYFLFVFFFFFFLQATKIKADSLKDCSIATLSDMDVQVHPEKL